MCRVYFLSVLLVVLSTVNKSHQRSSVSSPDYVAAVVEYNPTTSGQTDEEIFDNNVDIYQSIIENATRRTDPADIIVFPELGLVTFSHRELSEVPHPETQTVPCTDTSGRYGNLRQLSCAARDNEVYVVVNLFERFPCPRGSTSDYDEPCPIEEVLNYNTNVVFDRTGAVIARYRKTHLFLEKNMVTPPTAELATFTTDFGVKFGLVICFDLMFEDPAIKLVKQENITDIIFPSAWYSELPFTTAGQAQSSFAYTMDVNLLGAGYNNPRTGSGGSGIFSGRTHWDYVMPVENIVTQLIIGRVAKKNFQSLPETRQFKYVPAEIITLKPPKVIRTESYTLVYLSEFIPIQSDTSVFKSVPIVSDQTKERVCYNDFCCDFDILADLTSEQNYFYRMFAFHGVRVATKDETGGIQVCAVVFCADSTQASCGKMTPDAVATTFTSIRIKGSFNSKRAAQFPNTLLPKYRIIPPDEFSFTQEVKEEKTDVEMKLLTPTPILTFGIFGRDFASDGLPLTKATSGAGSMPVMTALSQAIIATALTCC